MNKIVCRTGETFTIFRRFGRLLIVKIFKPRQGLSSETFLRILDNKLGSGLSGLGIKIDNFSAVAHTLPFSGPIDGLLGMDFLRRVKARIDLENNLIEIP